MGRARVTCGLPWPTTDPPRGCAQGVWSEALPDVPGGARVALHGVPDRPGASRWREGPGAFAGTWGMDGACALCLLSGSFTSPPRGLRAGRSPAPPLGPRAPGTRNPPPPLCDIRSGCCSFTGPWTVTRSSLRMLRRVATFCRPLRPVLLLVSFQRSRSPVVGVLGLC